MDSKRRWETSSETEAETIPGNSFFPLEGERKKRGGMLMNDSYCGYGDVYDYFGGLLWYYTNFFSYLMSFPLTHPSLLSSAKASAVFVWK